MAIIDHLRAVATGEQKPPDFSPKDWRGGSIAHLLWCAAEEIERLKGLLADNEYIKRKAAHNRSGASYNGWLAERERNLEDEMYRHDP